MSSNLTFGFKSANAHQAPVKLGHFVARARPIISARVARCAEVLVPIVVCPNCGAKNRVDAGRADSMRPVCGKCGTPLIGGGGEAGANGGKPIEMTDDK